MAREKMKRDRTSVYMSFEARDKLNKIVEVYQEETDLFVTQFHTLNRVISEKYDELVKLGKIKGDL